MKRDRHNGSVAQSDRVHPGETRDCANRATKVSEQLERLRSETPLEPQGQFSSLDEATRYLLEQEFSRRRFIAGSMAVAGGVMATQMLPYAEAQTETATTNVPDVIEIALAVNGRTYTLQVDPRASLLDTLRDDLGLTGAKKGCNQGTCGACTVQVDGERILSCLALAPMSQGREITTIEGLSDGVTLHPLQAAFIQHDALQCGYCTTGQIMSAEACIREGHASSELEIREWMSGNLCRCSAYSGIVAAIQEVAAQEVV